MPDLLSEKDRLYLRRFDEIAWKRSKDRFGHMHAFALTVAAKKVARVLKLVDVHDLPCVLCSGPYGDLWMRVYDHSEAIGVRPEYLVAIAEDHILKDPHAPKKWNDTFDAFSKYTHSARMREILSFYGLPLPQPRSEYEY